MVKFKKLRIVGSSILGVSMIISSASVSYSKITPKHKNSELIVIKKGDTLWDLAGYYYKYPYRWPQFKKYNIFTDPHWIYPGEKLAIGRDKAKEICVLLEQKIKRLEKEKLRDKNKINELEQEIKKLRDSAGELVAQLISEKEREISKLREEISSGDEENDMLKGAMLELQIKLVESQATINMQQQEIQQLIKIKNIALNTSYFVGFAVISTILAGKVVR